MSNELTEVRADIKQLIAATSVMGAKIDLIEEKLDEHSRPCEDFKQHVEEHREAKSEKKSALVWLVQNTLSPALTALVVYYLATKYGIVVP